MVQRDLVEAAQLGDHDAFEALATRASVRLYSLARLILRDADLAQDAVQDALVTAWRKLPSLREPDRFDAWVNRLVVSACADARRKRIRRAPEVPLIDADRSVRDSQAAVADRDQLERGFLRLRTEYRTVIVLHHYLGLHVPEIAEMLGLPDGTVKSRIHYATEVLRAAMEADDRPPVLAPTERTA